MNPDQSLAIMKALADQSRLAIVNSLLERSQYVEELASRHGLAPSTVSFHLKKLEQAGLVSSRKEQYYVMICAKEAIFDTTLRQIVSATPGGRELQDARIDEYRRKVVETFFRNGRLDKLPAQHKKRLIVLEQFAAKFQQGRRYDEQEVTGLIRPLHDDYCIIRRLLVDEGLLRREGGQYWRDAATAAAGALPLPASNGAMPPEKPMEARRREIKREIKAKVPDMGVYRITNTINGKIYVGSSKNLEGTRTSRLFQLRMGKVPFSTALQQELNECGAAAFEFSVLSVLDRTDPEENLDLSLAALELHWQRQLQPFGDKGYNSERAYQRNMERLEQSGWGRDAS